MIYQRQLFPFAATLAVSLLTACSGGSSSSPALPAIGGGPAATPSPVATAKPTPVATATPTPVATATPTPIATATPAAAPLATAILAGAAGFINVQSHTVYVFDADLATPGASACNGQCATVWPSVPGTANTAYPAPFTTITRSDGTLQLAYSGRPLYTYIADSAPGSIAGNGITSFGAVWHIARPAGAAAPSPSPTATTPPTGY